MAQAHPVFTLGRASGDGATIELGVLRNAAQDFIAKLRRYLRRLDDHAKPGTLRQIRGELNKIYDEFERNLIAEAPLDAVTKILGCLNDALDALDHYSRIPRASANSKGASIPELDKAEGIRVQRRRALLEQLDRVWESLR